MNLSQGKQRRMVAFEIWCYNRILNISWVDKVTKEEVLGREGGKQSYRLQLTYKKYRLIGHIFGNKSL